MALLRQGQIVFGTVSLAHMEGIDQGNPDESSTERIVRECYGRLLNTVSSIVLKHCTGQFRRYPYLHAAVYAGEFTNQRGYIEHYVIENGGTENDTKCGMIQAQKIEDAFENSAYFFILSPAEDYKGRSTRYMVLQRALACLGLYYRYSLRSVNCEIFVMTLMNLDKRIIFQNLPLQDHVLKKRKGRMSLSSISAEVDYQQFHKDLMAKISQVGHGHILRLKYYLTTKTQDKMLKNIEKLQCGSISIEDLLELNRGKSHWFKELDSPSKKRYHAGEKM